MAQSDELTGNSSGSAAIQPARRTRATVVRGTSGFASARDRSEVDGPAVVLPHQAGSLCLAARRLVSFLRDELLGELPGFVVAPPGVDVREGAVGELLQQPA